MVLLLLETTILLTIMWPLSQCELDPLQLQPADVSQNKTSPPPSLQKLSAPVYSTEESQPPNKRSLLGNPKHKNVQNQGKETPLLFTFRLLPSPQTSPPTASTKPPLHRVPDIIPCKLPCELTLQLQRQII